MENDNNNNFSEDLPDQDLDLELQPDQDLDLGSDLDIIDNSEGYWVDTTGGKRFFIDGIRYKQLKNGVIYDLETHRFCGTVEKTLRFKRGLNASEAINKRWEDYRGAAAEGLARAGGNSQGGSPEAWSLVVEHQARLAMDKEQGFASTKAAEFVGKSIGALDERGKLPKDSGSELSGLLSGLQIDKLQLFIAVLTDND